MPCVCAIQTLPDTSRAGTKGRFNLTIKNCRHHKLPGECGFELCEHYSGHGLDDVERYFGGKSSSADAQNLFRTDRVKYDCLRAIAVERKLLWI